MRWSDRRTDPDAEYLPERARLEELGVGLMSLEDERWWTAQSRAFLQEDGAPLPPCRLDPLGRDCVQRDHSRCPGPCRVALGRHKCDMLGPCLGYLEGHGGPFCFATLIDPVWARPSGKLGTFDLIQVRRTLSQRFARLGATNYGGFGMIEFDFSKNDDGLGMWTPHLHFVSAGLEKKQVQAALAPRSSARLYPGHKPLVIKEVEPEELPRVIGYSTKQYASDRVCGNKQCLSAARQLEYERFTSLYSIADFFFLVHLRRYGRKLVSPAL